MKEPLPRTEFTEDQKHASTLAMLAEVRDYLRRLPPHPLTTEMIRKVEAHLEQPSSRLLSRSEQLARAVPFASNGVPLAQALLRGSTVAVRVPFLDQPEAMPQDFLQVIKSGFLLGFEPIGRSNEPLSRATLSEVFTDRPRVLEKTSENPQQRSKPFEDLD